MHNVTFYLDSAGAYLGGIFCCLAAGIPEYLSLVAQTYKINGKQACILLLFAGYFYAL